jgi:hypothetical protein
LWAGIGLALEAEIVYLAGIRLGSPFLRRLGARTFALSLARVAWGAQSGSQTLILGHSTYDWAPPALFHAFLFWTNRALRRPNAIFSWCAALIAAIVLAAETPAPFIGAAWILLGLSLFEIGLRRQLSEFRRQSYCLFAGGVGFASLADWRGLAIGIAALYTAALRSRAMAERFRFALGACLGTAFLAAILLWTTVPPEYFGLALCALAVTVLELGSHNLPTEMRLCFGPLALAATALVIGSNFDGFVKFPTAPVYLSYLGACLAATAAAVRLTWRPPDRAAEWERTALRDAMVFLACAAAMTTVWLTIPDPVVTVLWTAIAVGVLISFPAIAGIAMVPVYARTFDFDLQNAPLTIPVAVAGMYWLWRRFRRVEPWDTLIFWAALLPTLCLIAREAGGRNMALGWVVASIVLLIVGNRAALPHARYQSYFVALLAFGAALLFDIHPPQLGLRGITICGMTVTGLYAAQYFAHAQPGRRTPLFFSLLGTLLLISLLFGRVSGGLLTVSWGLQGLALLGCGFGFRERILRLQGLALLFGCILKLFLYDLRNLQAIYRILSFVALGLILLSVSWIYSRFREHIRRLL